ncbi:Intermediate cleaving peptidase 55 [Neolecta irregularis DAH-3]|uniref:Intermediate cleaving peptidase 55 n=1 Tax=Neolecta irregularis (strain DAH-3) TaxID=1198029 RepID=A0A1U7LW37_NEOID|nr:Intermediate cleaving peptidase 55 [Neolecta irregularis DAH-3]|eukprot:OLL26762.1 Intermediate cleaving peptidase 55 [Neolecta irregularis DAH-3]
MFRVSPILKRTIQTKSYGQPLPQTHPHLFTSHLELTPGIPASEYKSRRDRLAAKLSEGDLAIIAGSAVQWRSSSVFYPFYQNSDFSYISGFLEPDALIVLERSDSYDRGYKYHLYAREKDPHEETWQGSRSGNRACIKIFGSDTSTNIATMSSSLNELITRAGNIYVDLPTRSSPKDFLSPKVLRVRMSNLQEAIDQLLSHKYVLPLSSILHPMRAFKSLAEIECMRKAGEASSQSFDCVMSQSFKLESALWACFEHEIRRNGCHSDGYVPVVAGGENALILHYVENNNVLRNGDLVLLDGGGSSNTEVIPPVCQPRYGTNFPKKDITRTWPVNGKFSCAQKALVSAVLEVEKKCIKLCTRSAGLSLDDIHDKSKEFLAAKLKEIGFGFENYSLTDIYPHHIGHFVGLDVHDCAKFPRHQHLETSQVVTIEPGVYVPNDDRFPKHFRGMGIRIEDCVLVGEYSPTLLTNVIFIIVPAC